MKGRIFRPFLTRHDPPVLRVWLQIMQNLPGRTETL